MGALPRLCTWVSFSGEENLLCLLDRVRVQGGATLLASTTVCSGFPSHPLSSPLKPDLAISDHLIFPHLSITDPLPLAQHHVQFRVTTKPDIFVSGESPKTPFNLKQLTQSGFAFFFFLTFRVKLDPGARVQFASGREVQWDQPWACDKEIQAAVWFPACQLCGAPSPSEPQFLLL